MLEVMPLFYYHLVATPVFCALLIGFRRRSERAKYQALYGLCAICLIFYLVNDYYFYIRGSHLLTMLPLQLCNIGVFLIPITVLSRKPLLQDFVFYLSVPGALAALMTPNADYSDIPYSMMTISFYISHFVIAIVPLLMAGWGLYRPEPSARKALRLSATVLVLAGGLYLFSIFLNRTLDIGANYFFTIIEYSAPINPVFALFARIIPYNFVYLIPALPILYIYMGIVYALTKVKPRHSTRVTG